MYLVELSSNTAHDRVLSMHFKLREDNELMPYDKMAKHYDQIQKRWENRQRNTACKILTINFLHMVHVYGKLAFI